MWNSTLVSQNLENYLHANHGYSFMIQACWNGSSTQFKKKNSCKKAHNPKIYSTGTLHSLIQLYCIAVMLRMLVSSYLPSCLSQETAKWSLRSSESRCHLLPTGLTTQGIGTVLLSALLKDTTSELAGLSSNYRLTLFDAERQQAKQGRHL